MKTTFLGLIGAIVAAGSVAQPFAVQTPAGGDDSALTRTVGDVQVVALTGDVAIERLRGATALSHLYNLLSRKPEAFAAARKALAAQGFQPTDVVYVERTLRRARRPGSPEGSHILPAQTSSEANQDGEIVFWSWDDGDNATWEGAIYMDVYSAGAAATWQGQIDDSTADHPWIYYRRTWEGSDAGGPRQVGMEGPPRPGYLLQAVPAVLSAQPLRCVRAEPASFTGWAHCWRACVLGSCTTAAIGCRWSAPLWPECWAAWCVGAEVGCGITCFMMN